jgi:hypothetical protein
MFSGIYKKNVLVDVWMEVSLDFMCHSGKQRIYKESAHKNFIASHNTIRIGNNFKISFENRNLENDRHRTCFFRFALIFNKKKFQEENVIINDSAASLMLVHQK